MIPKPCPRIRADCRAGFTIVELLIVITIAAILTGTAVAGFNGYSNRQSAKNSRDSFVYLSMRARSAAMERGRAVRLEMDPVRARAWVVTNRSGEGDTLQVLDYLGDYKAEVMTPNNAVLRICYSPQGYALSACTTVAEEGFVQFSRAGHQARASVSPLGQVRTR